ncbi:two-component regulator propeller domain-containing protein [Fulvivirga kasyanovii]|uniref:histidine kinase n=1 Tax=Fulvivirga kasyanovii TaxID=396812 RepID=A0ABW9S0B0_9BACT|nr:sensor histidine kinase [Fulvivirga kasyanovii]MTI28850.1 sensor histidine kinase [Fulvivirga kasyanovii]
MNKKYHIVYLLIALLQATTVVAQFNLEKVKFSRPNEDTKLYNSTIPSILQDSYGFVWIGTSDGLNRYDGYEYTVYRNDPNDSSTLLRNTILSLYEDSEGTLWVSTSNGGLHTYDRERDCFKRIENYSYDCEISQIIEDADKNLWIAGIQWPMAFVARLNRATGKWQHFDILSSKTPVSTFIPESENTFWVGLNNTGFFKWNAQNDSLISYQPDESNPNSIVSNEFHKAIKDTHGNIWIGTKHGLSRLDPSSGNFTNYTVQAGEPKGLRVNNILTLCEDENYIWIGTENGGLSRLDTRTNTIRTFINDKYDPSSVVDNSIHALYRDRQGRIWVGTYSRGLCVYDKLKYKFSELDVPLKNNVVNAIRQDSKKRIWLGTEEGVVMKDQDKVQHFQHIRPKEGFSTDPVICIYEDRQHQMWFGTWSKGTSRYDEANGKFINYFPDKNNPESLSDPNVFSICQESKKHRMLFGTYGGINVLRDQVNGIFTKHTTDIEFNNYIRIIYEDSQQTIWVGTIEELTWYNPDNGEITRFGSHLNNGASVVSGLVGCITEDKKGRLWVGTTEGLHLIIDKKLIKKYTTEQGLPNNVINGILEDDHGNLWLSTNEGIARFNPEDGSVKKYDTSDGLLSNSFKANSCFKNSDGWMFFGGNGVNVFHPDSLNDNPHSPPVYITGLKLFNQSVSIGDETGILQRNITETQEITLPHRYNFFSISFVGLNFTSTNKNKYAYKLEGFDREWNYVDDQRTATFTNLDAGTYTFRVKASNNDQLWNEEGASLTIHILPAWWQTWWARLIAATVLIGATILYYRMRMSSIKKRNKLLKRMVDERTKALVASQRTIEEQNEEIKQQNEWLESEVKSRTKVLVEYSQQLEQFTFMAAHNLRAPIARILGLGRLLRLTDKNEVEEAKEISEKLVRATKECDQVVKDLSLILDIKRNNTAVVSNIDIREEMELIKDHLSKEIEETKTRFEEDYSACTHINTVKPYFESILINLISNAIKYRHPDRAPVIKVNTDIKGDFMCLSVTDNGVGIDLSSAGDKLFTLYSQFHEHAQGKGMGLYLVKTQAVTLGGYVEVDSEVDKGTTFRIYFKTNQKANKEDVQVSESKA